MTALKVFVSSTSEDLTDYRAAARDVILDAGWQPVMMEHFPTDPSPIVAMCQRLIADCDLVLLLQAFRRGWVPTPEQRGDGENSMTAFELKAADNLHKPVRVFLAKETWPGNLWEEEPSGRAWVKNFRNGLNRSAKFFDVETTPFKDFRSVLREALSHHKDGLIGSPAQKDVSDASDEALQNAVLRPPPAEQEPARHALSAAPAVHAPADVCGP